MLKISLQELIAIVDGRPRFGAMPPVAGDATPVGRIVTDSRQVKPGDVFWALVGKNHNGADFACEAYSRGAEGVVLAGRGVEPWAGCWSLEVEDASWALWQLATVVRHRFAGRVIAVTGSVGKTTTRQMIHTILGSRFRGTASPRNFNNHLGLPLSMLNWREDDDYAVVELGASRRGEIAALAELCDPHIGVVTRIAEAHLHEFGSRQAIAAAKRELLLALPPDGTAILGDDESVRRLAADCPCQTVCVGRDSGCDLFATHTRVEQGSLSFRVDRQDFHVPVWGRHHLSAALAAIAVGQTMNMTLAEISVALSEFQPVAHRCQIVESAGKTIIDDTYNACPSAMRAALELLRDFDSAGRRVVVCGDMKELGPESSQWHRQIGDEVVTVCGADLLIACGQYARDVVTGARDAGMPLGRAVACTSPRDAVPVLRDQLAYGDVVLVKGSRALTMERVVDALVAGDQQRAA